MRILARVALAVFAVAVLFGVGVLATLWFAWGPTLPLALLIARTSWFDIALLVALGITLVGLVALIVMAIAMPSKHTALAFEREGGSVSVSKDALRSTVERTVEAHYGLTCASAKVSIKGAHDPRIIVHAKVDPGANVDLATLGSTLQREVASSVGILAGCPVERVDIAFTKASTATVNQPASTAHTAQASSWA